MYERRREYSEEQRDEYDNYVKEERDGEILDGMAFSSFSNAFLSTPASITF